MVHQCQSGSCLAFLPCSACSTCALGIVSLRMSFSSAHAVPRDGTELSAACTGRGHCSGRAHLGTSLSGAPAAPRPARGEVWAPWAAQGRSEGRWLRKVGQALLSLPCSPQLCSELPGHSWGRAVSRLLLLPWLCFPQFSVTIQSSRRPPLSQPPPCHQLPARCVLSQVTVCCA